LEKTDIDKVRDAVCDYCFDVCDHMKNSDRYHICSLHKENELSPECVLWQFLRYFYSRNEEKEVKNANSPR